MEKPNSIFLIDTNSFITPYKKYYPFDLAPIFWQFMELNIKEGCIVLLDKVYDELVAGSDELTDWVQAIKTDKIIEHKNPEIIMKYGEILTYIQHCGFYKSRALTEWSDSKVADPWIIATASIFGYTVITFEEPNGNLSKSSPCSHPKIPEICKAFDVKCANLFDMMRALSFSIF